jgi:ATP-dependent Clp protease ATP-binding subunit ClpA
VVFTTNVGAKEMVDFLDRRTIGFRTPHQDVEATGQQIYQIGFESLQKVFQPEWINRLDEIVAFRPLSSEVLRQVLDHMLLESNEQYLRHGIQVEVSAEAKEYLLDKGFDSRFGARPLRQRLLKDLDAPLADLLASGGVPAGSKVLVVYTGVDQHGQALEFYHQAAPDVLRQSEELRAAEVGRVGVGTTDGPQPPSVSLTSERGNAAENSASAGPFGSRGPRVIPPRRNEGR